MSTSTGSSGIRLTDEASIPAVVAELTLLEKAKLCGGATSFETHAVERLGIPRLTMADGHNGVNIFHLFGNYVPHAAERAGVDVSVARTAQGKLRRAGLAGLKALIRGDLKDPALAPLLPEYETLLVALVEELKRELPDEAGLPSCLPPGVVMSATWDIDFVAEYGRAMAIEARAFGMDILLGPNVNIHRDPLCGRVFESYSEDPYQTARIGVSYIKGLQEEGVAGVVKHYVANNQEHERQGINTKVAERPLQEIYYPAFKAAIREADSWMVMSAYNSVNGPPCAMSPHLLQEVLREQWGFEGFVVSDWGAAYDRVVALQSGNDLEMPGPCDPQELVDAVKRGDMAESVLDACVTNILRITLRLPVFLGKKRPAIDRAGSAAVARRCAAEGAVLLKNEGGALPFAGGKIAVFGDNATDPISTGKGSAMVYSPYIVSVAEGMTARFGSENVSLGDLDNGASLAIICIGVGSGEGSDRSTMDLDPSDVDLIRDVAGRCRKSGTKSVVVLNVCAPVEMVSWVDEVDAVVLAWMGGQEIGHAVADIISGDVCPSGKLPITFPKRYNDTPARLNFPGEFGEVNYGEGIFVGYRYYDTVGVEPLYEFGYGLSYTRFELSDIAVSADSLDAGKDQSVTVSVKLTNTGAVAGKEVVQLYLRDIHSTIQKADKELKGFRKVGLAPGETTTVKFELTTEAFAHFDSQKDAWCVEPGLFEILVGTSSRDIRCTAKIRVVGDNPYAYDMTTAISRVMRDEAAVAILARHLPATALEDPLVKEIIEFIPNVTFQRVWGQHFMHHLGGVSAQDIEKRREQILAEFARIQVD